MMVRLCSDSNRVVGSGFPKPTRSTPGSPSPGGTSIGAMYSRTVSSREPMSPSSQASPTDVERKDLVTLYVMSTRFVSPHSATM